MKNRLLESLDTRTQNKEVTFRRYALSEIISESYKSLYACEKGSNLHKLAEAHLTDVRSNPTDIDRLSRQLCKLKYLQKMVESNELEDEGILVPEESHDKVEPEDIKESIGEDELEEGLFGLGKKKNTATPGKSGKYDAAYAKALEKTPVVVKLWRDKSHKPEIVDYFDSNLAAEGVVRRHQTDVDKSVVYRYMTAKEAESMGAFVSVPSKYVNKYLDEAEDISLEEETELTEEEVQELAKHLEEIRKNKKIKESTSPEEESDINESKSWGDISLAEFNKKSAGKAFVKTFKKLDAKLHEGTALTRQESITLYKAANSAMTHLSVELEHNPEFLPVFTESVTLLSTDVAKLLESMKNGKAPSKATMKSLAKFSEALLREADEDEEELPHIEDEENEFVGDEEEVSAEEEENIDPEEEEQFDQEYADARVELHKEIAEEHADSEDPEVQEKLAQDAEEVANLPGITDEQKEELGIQSDSTESDEDTSGDGGESTDDISLEGEDSEDINDSKEVDDSDITEDELAELKKHLTEMRRTKKIKESKGRKLMRRN